MDSFATDSEISQRINGQIVQRKLEAWDPVEDEKFDEKLRDAELGGDVSHQRVVALIVNYDKVLC